MTWRGGGHPDELISASLAGDMTDAERAELDAHLARCGRCRATLVAFKSERRILSGLPMAGPPDDLPARVRSGIEAGRFGAPWWRRPGSAVPLLASAAAFVVVILAVVVLGRLPTGQVGQASGSPEATDFVTPSSSAAVSPSPSETPTRPQFLDLGAGGIGYLAVDGAPFAESHLTFVDVAAQASIDAGTVAGPPIAAALAPDRKSLAYITEKGETGANEVWVLRLDDGRVTRLGCSLASSFTNRLAWSPDSQELAFTLIAVDLGSNAGCPANTSPPGSADVWVYLASDNAAYLVVGGGNAFASSFMPGALFGNGEPPRLLVSHAAATPWTSTVVPFSECCSDRIDGVFLPLVSPDGSRALYWNGTMAQSNGVWQFSRGGLPHLTNDFRSTGPASAWIGTALITDLTPVGGEAFANGSFTWGPDSDLIAFWDGAWTGAPQSPDGTYPTQQDVLVGRISTGLLTSASRVLLALESRASIVDVAIRPDGGVAVTVRLPSAGIGDPPSASLHIASLDSVGVAVVPPRWAGPAIYGR